MQDYWNDPSEEPEIPECCDAEMTVDRDGDCKCESCGAVLLNSVLDIEPPDCDEWKCEKCQGKYPCSCEVPREEESGCPHGNSAGHCDHCDHLGDLAFDAARESRCFR